MMVKNRVTSALFLNTIYLVETKKEGDIDSSDVQEKARAADIHVRIITCYASTRNTMTFSVEQQNQSVSDVNKRGIV